MEEQPFNKAFETLSEVELRFIFEQSEKLLKETSNVSSILVGRTNTLITIVLTLLTASLAYAINNFDSNRIISVSVIFCAFFLYFLCWSLYRNLKGKDYHNVGRNPQYYTNEHFTNSKNDKIKDFLIAEICNIKEDISVNNSINAKRWKQLHFAMLLLLLTPIVFVIFYLLIFFVWTICLCPCSF